MLRGIASFGPRHIVRTDESLSMSEDLPVTIAAVDTPEVIGALADDVVALIEPRPDHPGTGHASSTATSPSSTEAMRCG